MHAVEAPVSRIVRKEIGPTTTPIECFHGHTNFFHELTRVVSKKNSKGLCVNNYTSGPMLCSSPVVPRLVSGGSRGGSMGSMEPLFLKGCIQKYYMHKRTTNTTLTLELRTLASQ